MFIPEGMTNRNLASLYDILVQKEYHFFIERIRNSIFKMGKKKLNINTRTNYYLTNILSIK